MTRTSMRESVTNTLREEAKIPEINKCHDITIVWARRLRSLMSHRLTQVTAARQRKYKAQSERRTNRWRASATPKAVALRGWCTQNIVHANGCGNIDVMHDRYEG